MAVYTSITESELRGFLQGYDLGALKSFEGIQEGVENSNFKLVTDRGPYILTIFERRVREEDLPYFLGLSRHLSEKGISCPDPFPAKNGAIIGRLKAKPAAIISFLEGRPVWPPAEDHCRQAGELVGQMQLAGQDFAHSRKNDLGLAGWHDLMAKTRDRADKIAPGLAAAIAKELDFLQRNWPQNLPKGAVHADLFHDNVFFKNAQLSGVIDFYFACDDFYAYDLAVTLNAWCFGDETHFDRENAAAMINGYQTIRPFSVQEKSAFPVLCRGAAMRFLLTRLYDTLNRVDKALVTVKDPLAYLNRLKFHQSITGWSGYGFV